MIVVVLGQIGSGKTVQAKLLSESRGYYHFSVGAYLRSAMADDPRMLSGELVDNHLVENAITSFFDSIDPQKGVIMDGFPRLLEQKEWFDMFLASRNMKVDKALLIEVSEEEIQKRLSGRHREDDTAEAIKRRKEIFRNVIETVAPSYEHDGALYVIDGLGSIEEVHERVERAV